MPVVVDDGLVVELFRLDTKAGRSKRPETDSGVDDPIPGRVHGERDRSPGEGARPVTSAARVCGDLPAHAPIPIPAKAMAPVLSNVRLSIARVI